MKMLTITDKTRKKTRILSSACLLNTLDQVVRRINRAAESDRAYNILFKYKRLRLARKIRILTRFFSYAAC